MQRIFILFLTVFVPFVYGDYYELNIIHHNDFHARFDQTSITGTVCNELELDSECIGGFARLYTAIHEILEAEPHSILLNGGDVFQGTLWYNFLKWNATQYFMNMLPHDANVLGNHDFDDDVDGLVPYLKRLKSPMLVANLNSTFEPRMQGLYQNHVVIERNGRKIGIIGVMLTKFASPIGDLIIEDELVTLKREADILTEQGVNIIIALTHTGYQMDKYFAEHVGPNVDIIVGSHSHTLLFNGEAPNGDKVYGNYPTVVIQESGHKVLVVQADCNTRYLGNIKLFFDEYGIVQGWEGSPIFLGSNVLPDPKMLELLAPYKAEMDAIGKQTLGVSKVTLSDTTCHLGECNIGDFTCDGFIHEVMEKAEENHWSYADLCLVSRWSIRTRLDAGEITTEELILAFPFEHTVQTFSMYGRDIWAALEHSVSGDFEDGVLLSYKMLQVGGLRVVYNGTQPSYSRVKSLKIRCTKCPVPVYEDVVLDQMYRVVSHNYLAEGWDDYSMIAKNHWDVVNIGLDNVVLQNYVKYLGIITQDMDGRIQVVY